TPRERPALLGRRAVDGGRKEFGRYPAVVKERAGPGGCSVAQDLLAVGFGLDQKIPALGTGDLDSRGQAAMARILVEPNGALGHQQLLHRRSRAPITLFRVDPD